jgi:hypothetical protein
MTEKPKRLPGNRKGCRHTEEARRRMSEAHKGKTVSEETRRKIREAITGQVRSEEVRRRMSESKVGKKNKGRAARGPGNCGSMKVTLRSPDNRTFRVINVAHFVRENPDLFLPGDVEWKRRGDYWSCRAVVGLYSLSPRRKNPIGSWKGWTVVSLTETFHNQEEDLLERTVEK